ncbi:NusG domain II-containing protein [Enterocloster bolteae]|uniref:NusG domain II-containing protein n=1 Tax=Clostridia TaxID=186801 RepID=UPI001106AFD5|nr:MULTISPECIES: NusG domain II-containing protein [Clostridia]MCB7090639.1 NusG domain II-containing protein [Enterocloster bolteae]MCH1935292.1 NusG domain II-containing protein [Enterocloster sp. OA11]
MKLVQKRDLILAAAILLIAAAAVGINHFIRRAPAAIAQVSVDGIVVETLELSKDTEITVTSSNGGTNHLIVKDGEIWCSDASCPDKVCVHQGKKHLNSDTIVCLPNQMIVTITGGD